MIKETANFPCSLIDNYKSIIFIANRKLRNDRYKTQPWRLGKVREVIIINHDESVIGYRRETLSYCITIVM